MKLTIILDGAAEDRHSSSPTTLELACLPTLDTLAASSSAGLFDPRDVGSGTVQTDMIVSSILGIRPQRWPGRSYYELHNLGRLEGSRFAAVLAFYPQEGDRNLQAAEIRRIIAARLPEVRAILAESGLSAMPRTHSRLGLSLLIYGGYTIGEKTLDAVRRDLEEALYRDDLVVRWLDRWTASSLQHPTFCGNPAIFSFAQGSLPSLMTCAGVRNLSPPERTEFNPASCAAAFAAFVQAAEAEPWKSAILYFKDPDWASHRGDRASKIEVLEHFDRLLGEFMPRLENLGLDRILVISDHRTNIAAPIPSATPSVFWIRDAQPGDGTSFHEAAVEARWGERQPLTMAQLHLLMFHPGEEIEECHLNALS